MSISTVKITEHMLTSYIIENGLSAAPLAPSNDPIVADSMTMLMLREIQVSPKDAGLEWNSLHVALCIEGISNPVVFKAQLELQTADSDKSIYKVAATHGVQIETTGKLLKIAVVMVNKGDLCCISAFRLKFDVVKRCLRLINVK